jgi:hypothetical protein
MRAVISVVIVVVATAWLRHVVRDRGPVRRFSRAVETMRSIITDASSPR